MTSIARSLRPVVSRIVARPSGVTSSWGTSSFGVRAFSVTRIPQAKKYTKDHEWVELSEDNKTAYIGISEFAAHSLGDVVYVELPTTPLKVAKGDAIGAVESVKSASDINSPISCKITSVNELLEERPGTMNKGPEDDGAGGGWFAKVEVGKVGVEDLEELMDAAAYKKFTEDV